MVAVNGCSERNISSQKQSVVGNNCTWDGGPRLGAVRALHKVVWLESNEYRRTNLINTSFNEDVMIRDRINKRSLIFVHYWL